MFEGFSPETIDFLWGIRMNNNREWFAQHKKEYTKYLYEPMKALGSELYEPFAERPGNILKVSRIYRDARMHYPVPYKESLWVCIRQDVTWWAEAPCLFLEIRPEGVSYGFVLWKPSAEAKTSFQQEISAHPDEFLNLIKRTEKATGLPVTADCYRRPKMPEDLRLAPYFAWKGNICCIREEPVGPGIFTPELKDRAEKLLGNLEEIYDYFNRFHR